MQRYIETCARMINPYRDQHEIFNVVASLQVIQAPGSFSQKFIQNKQFQESNAERDYSNSLDASWQMHCLVSLIAMLTYKGDNWCKQITTESQLFYANAYILPY